MVLEVPMSILLSAMSRSNDWIDVRYWHKADNPTAPRLCPLLE